MSKETRQNYGGYVSTGLTANINAEENQFQILAEETTGETSRK